MDNPLFSHSLLVNFYSKNSAVAALVIMQVLKPWADILMTSNMIIDFFS